jgi:hypothetical protein
MFHAIIRNRTGVLHVIGEVEAYDLETLRRHVVGAARETAPAPSHLQIRVDPGQRDELQRRTRRWMRRLALAGVTVAISSLSIA